MAQVTLSLATLLGFDDAPGELAGHGTIPASVARDLAASATVWRRLLTDPVDSHLVTQEIKSYRPSAAMRAYVHARTGGVCASRGCTARRDLQIDHDTPHPRGPTSVTNTALLHQPHHQGKTCGAWCHHLHPDTGWLTQTSPLGRTYTTAPLPPLGGDLTGPAYTVSESRRRRLPGHDPEGSAQDLGPAVRSLGSLLDRTAARSRARDRVVTRSGAGVASPGAGSRARTRGRGRRRAGSRFLEAARQRALARPAGRPAIEVRLRQHAPAG